MKKIFYLIVCFILTFFPAFSLELQGGVKYSVDSARDYLQSGQQDYLDITGPYKLQAGNVRKSIISYTPQGDLLATTVEYFNEPAMAYVYDPRGNLIYVDKYDKSTDIYPHRGYRYKVDGTLDLTMLTVSKNEQFRFTPEGRLLAHSVNGIVYNETNQIIGRATR